MNHKPSRVLAEHKLPDYEAFEANQPIEILSHFYYCLYPLILCHCPMLLSCTGSGWRSPSRFSQDLHPRMPTATSLHVCGSVKETLSRLPLSKECSSSRCSALKSWVTCLCETCLVLNPQNGEK